MANGLSNGKPIAEAPPAAPLAAAQGASPPAPRVAIVGVPNTGKTLLFRWLTRRFAESSNYPHTTSALQRAEVQLGRRAVELIDTPGTSGLEFNSEDEAPTRALLAEAPPDVLVQCVDASNLVRSLLLTAQLADLEIPLVLCLNMVDEALGRGQFVDAEALAEAIGVPVVCVCGLDGRGVPRLAERIFAARAPRQVQYSEWLEERLAALGAEVQPRARRVDQICRTRHSEALPGQSGWHSALETHLHWARDVAAGVTRATGLEPRSSAWDRLAQLALHPVGGWVFLLGAIAALYLLVAEVGVKLLAVGMERLLVLPLSGAIASWAGPGLLGDVLVGEFGLLSLGVFNALCTVLPILAVFYLAFGFLEDVGYFPLLSVQFDRLLRFVGLTGRAVLPMTLGFGCNSVATMATRCLESPRQRYIACFMIALGIPCAVQLGVIVAILASVPALIIVGLLGYVVLVQILAGTALARLLPRCGAGEFLVELPPLRAPRWRNILAKARHRVTEFFLEALPMFVASAAVLLALQLSGLLQRLRELAAPLVEHGLGLPAKYTDVLLMTLARREVGAVMMKDLVDGGGLTLQQIFIGLLVMTLFVPCMSNTLILGRVLGWLKAASIFVGVTLIAICSGLAVNLIWP